jgi:apolipoprotein D and lipocalin family protein
MTSALTKRLASLALSTLSVLAAAAPARAADVVDQMIADGRFNTFVAQIRSAGLEETFRYARTKTVFAPTDEAFAKLPADVVAMLSSDRELLRETVLGHVALKPLAVADLTARARDSGPWKAGLLTAAGSHLSVSRNAESGQIFINRSLVVVGDIAATNGLIHGVDSVLFTRLPMTSAPAVNLGSFMGKWFEIARLPNRMERGCAKSSLEILPLADGGYTIQDSCQRGDRLEIFVGKLVDQDPVNHSRLEVSFHWPVCEDFWIVEFAADYALVASPSRDSMWILSRAPTLDEARVRDVLNRQIARGYAIGRVERVTQQ